MNIRKELAYEQFESPPPRRRQIVPYEKPYSAKKPKYCNVRVEYCLDCTESKCTYKRNF